MLRSGFKQKATKPMSRATPMKRSPAWKREGGMTKRQRKAIMAAAQCEDPSYPTLISKCQYAFNKFIRARDNGKPCISCGIFSGLQAGHYRSVGAARHLRFEEANVHGQCARCNGVLAGNRTGYRLGLAARLGCDTVENLECDNTPRHYSPEELMKMTKFYLKQARLLA